MFIEICTALVDIEIWHKILGSRVGILTSVFIADVRIVLSI